MIFQWEAKLERLRQEFKDNLKRICKCSNFSSFTKESDEKTSKCCICQERLLESSSGFEAKLRKIFDEQFDCRRMVEADECLEDSQRSLIMSQLQLLHNSELNSAVSKYDLQLFEQKKKTEELQIEAETRDEEMGGMKITIDKLQNENCSLKEKLLSLEMRGWKLRQKLAVKSYSLLKFVSV